MNSHKKSIISALAALVVVIIGLFLVCAQQRGTLSKGDDIASEDDQFKQELLQMLDLTDVSGDSSTSPEVFQSQDDVAENSPKEFFMPESNEEQEQEQEPIFEAQEDSEEDVLALLAPGEQSAQEPVEATATATADNMGLTEDMFSKISRDVDRLEKLLKQRSNSVDSLRRIIEMKNSRLQELEKRGTSTAPVTGVVNKSITPKTAAANRPSPQFGSGSGFMAEYESARTQFERFDYDGAIQSFQKILTLYPSHSEADNCQYWIGECYYGMKQYQQAVMEFQKVFAYTQTDKHDDAQLMIGLSYAKSGQKEKAQYEFKAFLDTYAGSEYSRIAERYYKNI
jgi:tol-pal system protein YbgF